MGDNAPGVSVAGCQTGGMSPGSSHSKQGRGVDKSVMGGVELYLMQLVNWAPLAGWKDQNCQFRVRDLNPGLSGESRVS